MLFNSFVFAIFFAIVYSLYWATIRHHKLQNRMLLIASCVFYGWWDWRFLGLMLFTIIIDYFVALALDGVEDKGRRKLLLLVSVVSNLGILGFFKYFNFFTDSFAGLLSVFGISADRHILNIVLPVGISFYTFQAMSYTIDVYRKDLKPVRDIFDYALFVTFFPQLVAGPIERATHLVPQVLLPRKIKLDQFYEGCYLIFWGLFKKVYIADNLALIVNPVFAAPGPYNGVQVLFATYAFAFQIYCDFSGYSDIARGLGKMMGFDIMVNFNLPYFSTNPSEFWRRWHISLSTWLRDYLYIPLGGNRKGELMTYRNLALTMLLGGLWHGAKWTFVVWGAYHGLLLISHRLIKPYLDSLPKVKNPLIQQIWFGIKVIFFFHLICISWIFFRAQSLTQSIGMLSSIANIRLVHGAGLVWFGSTMFMQLIAIIWCLVMIQVATYWRKDHLFVFKLPVTVRAFFYIFIFYAITVFGVNGSKEFIYFQF